MAKDLDVKFQETEENNNESKLLKTDDKMKTKS